MPNLISQIKCCATQTSLKVQIVLQPKGSMCFKLSRKRGSKKKSPKIEIFKAGMENLRQSLLIQESYSDYNLSLRSLFPTWVSTKPYKMTKNGQSQQFHKKKLGQNYIRFNSHSSRNLIVSIKALFYIFISLNFR